MGKLLQIDKQTRQTARRPAVPGPGELLFFTGVRYERQERPADQNRDSERPKRKRKRG